MTIRALRTGDLPADTVMLSDPASVAQLGGTAGFLAAVERVLERSGPALVVATSGSTGRPKKTVLSSYALRSSAHATATHTGGHGQWLLCLPTHYVAGAQVVVRSVLAGTRPVTMPQGSFTAQGFVSATATMTHPLRYASLVPTQLQRLVDARHRSGVVEALRSFTAILLGGSAATPALLDAAHDIGARVITTYGMSETAGGCVYDGLALPGVRVRLEQLAPEDAPTGTDGRTGRIWLGGPMVSDGYLDDPEQTRRHIFTQPPIDLPPDGSPNGSDAPRWYRTDDLGKFTSTPEGATRLHVLGRTDDVLITGGVKVSAAVVRSHILSHPGVEDAIVLGIPDRQWGQLMVAAVVPHAHIPGQHNTLVGQLSDRIRTELGVTATPKQWRLLPRLPLLPTGKPDRTAVAALFM
ncbi:MAG: AMP-binding protein [Kocuria sp.]|nr:AMP-binding protein [Kocuria sp.]